MMDGLLPKKGHLDRYDETTCLSIQQSASRLFYYKNSHIVSFKNNVNLAFQNYKFGLSLFISYSLDPTSLYLVAHVSSTSHTSSLIYC